MNDSRTLTDSSATSASSPARSAWKVLIADDDAAVHQVTKMVMSGFQFDDLPVQFISAFSGKEACEMIDQHPDIALVLLDVVMEDDQAGLNVAHYIREEAGNHAVRIVLRTGQPGQAPEEDVVRRYDINDYKDKTELTKTKLVTLFFSALRSYRDIKGQQDAMAAEKPSEGEQTFTSLQNPDSLPSDILISGMAHEIGTPLGVCISSLSYLQELIDRLKERAEQGEISQSELKAELDSSSEAAQLTWDNLQRSIELVKSFKAIANNQSGVTIIDFDLANLLQDLVRSLHFETRKKVPEITLSCPEGIQMSSDAGALTQVLSNLIMNSLRHGFSGRALSDENRIKISVRQLAGDDGQEAVELVYQDNGNGIAPENREHVFDAFFTTRGDTGGSGIGLALARELALKRLKGSLSLLDVDTGAGFRLTLRQRISD